jgi:tetratricopeptide (TPR) repeat protein
LNSRGIAPAQIKAWLTRAHDLHMRGQGEQAEALYRQVLSSQPGHPEALHLLGLLMHQRGNHNAAIDLIGRAIAINDRSPAYFANRGIALLAAGMPDAAIEHFQAALRLKPDLAQAYLNLGNALRSIRRFPEAAEAYRQAIRFAPTHANAYFYLGILQQEQGDLVSAAESFRQAVKLHGTNSGAAYYYLARCRSLPPQDGARLARDILAFLQRGDIDQASASYCHYALGKIHDDLGDYAEAFRHYGEANRLEHEHLAFDRAQHTGLIDRMISTFDAEFFAARRHLGSASTRPILIIGMPRSGTTLVEQIISSHSRVFGAGELEFWMEQAARLGPAEVAGMTRAQVAQVEEKYLGYLRWLSAAAEFVTDKMPHNYLHLGLIHLVFPHAKFIHCTRNPADTCISIYCHKFTRPHAYACDLDDLAFYYREYRRLMDHWRKVLPPEILQEVCYEDLVADQEGTSRSLIGSLGLEWEDNCLDFHASDRVVVTPSNWQVRQPIYKQSLARWKNYLPHVAPLVPLAEEYEQAAARNR